MAETLRNKVKSLQEKISDKENECKKDHVLVIEEQRIKISNLNQENEKVKRNLDKMMKDASWNCPEYFEKVKSRKALLNKSQSRLNKSLGRTHDSSVDDQLAKLREEQLKSKEEQISSLKVSLKKQELDNKRCKNEIEEQQMKL